MSQSVSTRSARLSPERGKYVTCRGTPFLLAVGGRRVRFRAERDRRERVSIDSMSCLSLA